MSRRAESKFSPGSLIFPQNIVTVDSKNEPITQSPAEQWTENNDPDALGGSYLTSNTTGDALVLTFKGTALWVRFRFHPHAGKSTVTIDGETVSTIDLYEPGALFKLISVAQELSNSTHTATVVVSGSKSFLSDDYYVDVDAMIYEMVEGGLQVLASIEGVVPVIGKVDVVTLTPTTYLQDTIKNAVLGWQAHVVGAGGAIARDATRYVVDGACLKLTTGATAGFKVYATKKVGRPLPITKRMAVSTYFTIPSDARYIYVGGDGLVLPHYTGTYRVYAGVRFDVVNSLWQYINALGAWTDVPDSTMYLEKDDDCWHFFEESLYLTDAGYYYDSIICNTTKIRLNQNIPLAVDLTPANNIYVVGVETNVNAAVDCYMDVLTIKELPPL